VARLAERDRINLDRALERARKRALKRGRTPPIKPGEDKGKSKEGEKDGKKKDEDVYYYDHWGYPYLYVYPYAYPIWWTPGLYCGYTPSEVPTTGQGGPGGCVAGTCASGVAAGACTQTYGVSLSLCALRPPRCPALPAGRQQGCLSRGLMMFDP
jgi:hypothetical protein